MEVFAGAVKEVKVRQASNEEEKRQASKEGANHARVGENRTQEKSSDEKPVVDKIGPPDGVRKLDGGC